MAFVNEFVSEEHKKMLKANEQFRYGGQLSEPYRWTVDRERDVFIIFVYGGLPPLGDDHVDPDHYAMSWKGHVIKFDAIQTARGNRNEGAIVDWVILNVCIPSHIDAKREIVLKLLQEGLEVMGTSTCNREGLIAVNVHFK